VLTCVPVLCKHNFHACQLYVQSCPRRSPCAHQTESYLTLVSTMYSRIVLQYTTASRCEARCTAAGTSSQDMQQRESMGRNTSNYTGIYPYISTLIYPYIYTYIHTYIHTLYVFLDTEPVYSIYYCNGMHIVHICQWQLMYALHACLQTAY
jgi:hypothetical protein